MQDEWVVCRVFHKNMGLKRTSSPLSSTDYQGAQPLRMNSFGDDFLDSSSSLPPLMDPTPSNDKPGSYGCYRFDYGEHSDHDSKGKITAAAPNKTASDIQYGINYLNHFQVGSSTRQLPNAAAAGSYQMSNPMGTSTMLYPQIHHHHQLIPNPSFSFQPNNPDYYFQQEIRAHNTSIPNNQGSSIDFRSSASDHQAILQAMAAAKNNNHNIETSIAAATAGDSRQCKVEQFSSNQSMFSLSQDTGLSTADMNTTTEISSSVVSKQEIIEVGSSNTLYEDHLESPPVVPISDIEGLWDY